MKPHRPLTPGEKVALFAGLVALSAGIIGAALRNWSTAEAWKSELGLALIGAALFTGVIHGLKTGAFGDRP
jgi:hypothetical protein